jgi:hypothetical protein
MRRDRPGQHDCSQVRESGEIEYYRKPATGDQSHWEKQHFIQYHGYSQMNKIYSFRA